MDKTAIKAYAIKARKDLIEAVKLKAQQLYIFEDSTKTLRPGTESERLQADGIFLSHEQLKARERLYGELLHEDMPYKPAIYNRVMENVACTWFNRLIALRIMEVNDWLPSNIRILSSQEQGRIEPDAMREVERLDYVSQAKVAELRADTDINAAEKLYKYILISQCNALSAIMPGMFQKEADYTELLLPDALLSKGGIVNDLVSLIHEDNFNVDKQGQIEIVGWLYQFYISEKKDEVFAGLKKNIKINKDTIPAATQLFTPEWIVKYMVENSLGRLWLEKLKSYKNSRFHAKNADEDWVEYPISEVSFLDYAGLADKWQYYIDEAPQSEEVENKLNETIDKDLDPRKIKLIDPCMGSGHILVYAFDVLYEIYRSMGYSTKDIPNLILTHNLYGLDIDDRAGQLAYFALMIKARSYNRRFFRQDNIPQPMVYSLNRLGNYSVYPLKKGDFLLDETLGTQHQETLDYLIDAFRDISEYGSLAKLEDRDYEGLLQAWQFTASQTAENFNMTLWFSAMENVVPELIKRAILLTQKYDVVVTNPPYMAPAPSQADWVKKNYPNSKSDLCVVFIERNFELLKQNGYLSMITMHSWMFLSSYEKFREKLIGSKDIVNMAHLGARAFEEIGGEVVQTTAFVMRCSNVVAYLGTYARLVDYAGQQVKEEAFLLGDNRYTAKKENFEKIPGWPVSYWVSPNTIKAYENSVKLKSIAETRQGMASSDDGKFVRYWHEVEMYKIGFSFPSTKEASESKFKWFPYNKGGSYRKWYGNNNHVINYENDGRDVKAYAAKLYKSASRTIKSTDVYFRKGLTWSAISVGNFSARYFSEGFVISNAGMALYASNDDMLNYLLALINSNVNVNILLKALNESLNYNAGDIARLPIIITSQERVLSLVKDSLSISIRDWDSFETSWDFQKHPLLKFGVSIYSGLGDIVNGKILSKIHIGVNKTADSFKIYEKDAPTHSTIHSSFEMWEQFTNDQFAQIKSNEEELNRIFIDIYGLQDELTPEVDDKDVTVRKADLSRDIRSFLSYAVGCMFGRYSLDEPGLVYAGGKFDMTKYKTFVPEDDNIIPIGSADYFDDDIVVRFIEFVRVIYGDNTLGENLNFIADALYPNGNGSAQDKIRRYFLNDFYKDHVKIYQKKPIYWLLDSGKKDGFKALFYLHRYDKYTVARARTDYLHPLQRKYEAEIKRLEMLSGSTENAREKAAYRKEIDALLSKIDECRIYDQVVSHIAHQQIELDLDDGVKVNYEMFQGVDVPMDNGKTEMMDLLGKI